MNRLALPFNDNWLYIKSDSMSAAKKEFNELRCQAVTLPHSYNAFDGADGDGYYYRGMNFYRKTFYLPKEYYGKEIFIEFGCANRESTLYVNDTEVGSHIGGYSTFRFNITEFVKLGEENFICLSVTNRIDGDLAPIRADSTSFGGILKEVSLIIANPVHFDLLDYGGSGVYVSTVYADESIAELNVTAKIQNNSEADEGAIFSVQFSDITGKTVSNEDLAFTIKKGGSKNAELSMRINNPQLWQGKNSPYLYNFKANIIKDGSVIDSVSFDYGIRTIKFDCNKGFLLNNAEYPIHGVAYSYDRLGKGRAISLRDIEEDMKLILEIGARGLRCPLYAPSDAFLSLCDRNGILVSLEVPVTNSVSNSDKFIDTTREQLKELIRQAYNHPSVITYGIANEIANGGLEGIPAPDPAYVLSKLNETIHQEDKYRYSHICANRETNTSSNFISDVTGWNIYNGWYDGEHSGNIESSEKRFDKIRKLNPGKCIGLSEFGPGASTLCHSASPKPFDYSEEYQSKYHEFYYSFIKKRPYIAFSYAWLLCDFACDARTECETLGQNNKGFVTFDRKTKKDVFYWYKANWSEEKFVHLNSSRFSPRPLKASKIRAYSNCDEVEFFCNGVSEGRISSQNHIFELNFQNLVEGLNKITAKGYTPDGTVTSDEFTALFSSSAKTSITHNTIDKNYINHY